MPTPPQLDELSEIAFVTNYFLLGCFPPAHLVVDFSREPLGDLAMLFLGVEAFDVAQALFEPKNKRRRSPARHGKKRRRRPGIPDPNELIGNRLRATLNPGDAFDLGPTRKAFKLLNAYEGFAFTVALIEGLVDVGFETLWGVMDVSNAHCREFARIGRHASGPITPFRVWPNMDSLSADVLDFNVGFFNSSAGTGTDKGDWILSVAARVTNNGPFEFVRGNLAIGTSNQDIRARSSDVNLRVGESERRTVWCEAKRFENLGWGWSGWEGAATITDFEILAFRDVINVF